LFQFGPVILIIQKSTVHHPEKFVLSVRLTAVHINKLGIKVAGVLLQILAHSKP